MKHLILNTLVCLTLVFIVSAQEPLQPVIMSERVGQEIDQAERAYFELFPDVLDFKFAQAFIASEDSIVIDIFARSDATSHENLIRKTLHSAEVQKLRDYLERFEAIAGDKATLSKVLIDKRVVACSAPAFRKGVFRDDLKQMTLGTIVSNTYAGKLLYATDSVLVFWKSNVAYDWRSALTSILVLEPTAIQILTLQGKSRAGEGAGLGILFGGALGAVCFAAANAGDDGFISPGAAAGIGALVFGLPSALLGGIIGVAQGTQQHFLIDGKLKNYARFLPTLQTKSYFFSAPAPEVARLIAERQHRPPGSSTTTPVISTPSKVDTSTKAVSPTQTSAAAQPTPVPARDSTTVEANEQAKGITRPTILSAPKFHLWLAGGFGDASANNDIEKAFQASGLGGTYNSWFGPIEYPHDRSNRATWNFGVAYSLTQNFRVAVQMKRRPKHQVAGINDELEAARGLAYSFGIEWIPKPALPFLLSHSEGMLGVGVIMNRIKVTGEMKSYNSWLAPGFPYAVSQNVFGAYAHGKVDYYFSRDASLQFGVQIIVLSKMDVSSLTYEFRQSSGVSQTKTLQAHVINFSGYDVSLGLQLHFF